MTWRVWLFILILVHTCTSRTSANSSTEERIRAARQEGAEEARKDLAAGTPKQYRMSGIVGPTYRYNWDPDTGLRIVDTGCIHSPAYDEYNRVVKEWIAEHGLPAASMKPRFVTLDIAQKTLVRASSLPRGGKVVGTPGKVMRLTKSFHDPRDTVQLQAESDGNRIWVTSVERAEHIRLAWSGHDSWYIEFLPGQKGEHGYIWHVDADGAGVLQTFDLAEQQ